MACSTCGKAEAMTCPVCGADDWKLARVVYNQGTHRYSGSTSGTSGYSTEAGYFTTSGSSTSGSVQSISAKNAKPPANPLTAILLHGFVGFFFWLLVGWLVGEISCNWSTASSAIGGKGTFGGVIIWQIIEAALIVLYISKGKKEAYQNKLEHYNITRVCQRCETFYHPALGSTTSASDSALTSPINERTGDRVFDFRDYRLLHVGRRARRLSARHHRITANR